MKKVLAALLALFLVGPGVYAQDDEIRPAAIGVSFILNDYVTAQRIRSSSLSNVLNNNQWAKVKEMAPGLALSYFKGLRKKLDLAGTLAGSYVSYTIPNHTPSSSDKFLLEGDASLNFKMVSEKYWVQPYLLAGVGAQMYGGTYFGAFIPTGVGLKVNLFDDAHFFITSQYRIPVTKGSVEYHFFNQFGIAGRIGQKKEPVVKALPPLPVDTDNDGIIDSLDKCPSVPGLTKYDGCPVPDTDKDGINDEEDKCPTEPGPASNQGCPFKDTDDDGIVDDQDKCPTVAGVKENDGCPAIPGFDAKNVQFVSGKATLSKNAAVNLDEMAAYLLKYPELKLVINGHTDNVGSAAVNQRLSERRAAAAKNYLVKKGVGADRITTAGYGMTQPIVDNKTASNRALNRRTEFKISQ